MSRSTTTGKRVDAPKPEVALYVGGMSDRPKNFHYDNMVRRGFGDAAKRIRELYPAGHKAQAIVIEPDEWVDLKLLVGPPAASANGTAPRGIAAQICSAYHRTSPKPSRCWQGPRG